MDEYAAQKKQNRFFAYIKSLPTHVKAQLWMLLIFPLNLTLILLAKNNPDTVETLFQNGTLRFLPRVLSKISGVLPFSLAEVLIVTAAVCGAVWLVFTVIGIIKAIKCKSGVLTKAIDFCSRIAAILLCLIFVFNIIYGLAYYRKNTSTLIYDHYIAYETEDIAFVSMYIVQEVNAARAALDIADDTPFHLTLLKDELCKEVMTAYNFLAEDYPVYFGDYGRPKPVALSKPWTYTYIMGIYIPFTGEANYNTNIPDVELPHTILHEMAHQRSIAAEDEANFAAFLASRYSDNAEVRYSGLFESYCFILSALQRSDKELYEFILSMTDDGVKTDIAAVDAFWDSYDTPLADISNSINNAYLESNGQEFGVSSYSLTVQYILDYYVNTYFYEYIA